ncbi:MAG: 2-ketoisovalerate ferredoxin oxidoreductase [Candidatus Altiarchaeales archaeon HGW-Altiarchaeales-1]|nr:MAG: 2-ketoisovalerate ferredoxin oxidoreductase [Candidatus Altiarchaeales archaeon HGW-Altiarchaeales-1]
MEELLAPGTRTCAGCGAATAIRMVLRAIQKDVGKNFIVCNATGCMEVATTPYPETSWRIPWIHVAFENVSAVASGVNAAYEYTSENDKNEKPKIIAIGGDGSTFDIGFGSLSGMLERNDDVLYICYDNEAYMNTGVQQSGSTPKFASTSTTPSGKAIPGNLQRKKNLVEIAAAHNVYAASTTIYNFRDLENKVRKALKIKGAKYIQIFASCPTGWRIPEKDAIKITKLAIETGIYKVFEIENGKFNLNYKPAKRKKVEEYLKVQGRFRHLTQQQIDEIQDGIDKEWRELEKTNVSAVTI